MAVRAGSPAALRWRELQGPGDAGRAPALPACAAAAGLGLGSVCLARDMS